MKRFGLAALGWALLTNPAVAQNVDNEPAHRAALQQMGLGSLRQGADGNNPSAPNAANRDEAKVGAYILPHLMGMTPPTTPEQWRQRRAEISSILENEIYGRVPAAADSVRINWKTVSTDNRRVGGVDAIVQKIEGIVTLTGSTTSPVIALELFMPAKPSAPVPFIVDMKFIWNGAPPPGITLPPDPAETILAKGWGYAAYVPVSIQADNGAGLNGGIIGLVAQRDPRAVNDWGTLRAWSWGASRVLDRVLLEANVDASRIVVAGLSRYGKAALVAAAYDERFATALVGSSGAGGAKLLRRDFGERVENLASSGEFHWFAPSFLKYAGPKQVTDLPADAHFLIAMVAPRPLFIATGRIEDGEAWIDPRGNYLGAVAATPAWVIHGLRGPTNDNMPPLNADVTELDLAFRQHEAGHSNRLNWVPFIDFAEAAFARRQR